VAAVTYINKLGGLSKPLNWVARKIYNLAICWRTQLQAIHVAGVSNVIADTLSHLHPQHKWELCPRIFAQVEKCWGPHTIDWFTSHANQKLLQYNSQFLDQGVEKVNALAQSWVGENNYAAPPITLIPHLWDYASCTTNRLLQPSSFPNGTAASGATTCLT